MLRLISYVFSAKHSMHNNILVIRSLLMVLLEVVGLDVYCIPCLFCTWNNALVRQTGIDLRNFFWSVFGQSHMINDSQSWVGRTNFRAWIPPGHPLKSNPGQMRKGVEWLVIMSACYMMLAYGYNDGAQLSKCRLLGFAEYALFILPQ